MNLPLPGPANGSGSTDEVTAEAIVRAWLDRGGAGLPPDKLEYLRGLADRFLQAKAKGGLPTPTSLDQAIAEARANCAAWSAEEFMFFCWWMERHCEWTSTGGWHARLLDAVAESLPADCLGPATFYVWKRATNPQEHLLTGRWRELFEAGGYVEDTVRAQRPSGHVVLYRGSGWDTRASWSWTSTWVTAEEYRVQRGGSGALVWVALVPWRNVLARNRLMNASVLSDEWVVDTMDRTRPGWTIPIRPLDLPVRRSHWPQCRTGRMAVTFTAQRCQECGALVDGRSAVMFESVSDAFFGRRSPSWRR